MYQPTPWGAPSSSFGPHTPPPGAEPASGPLVALYCNPAWVPYILGACAQLCRPSIWDAADQSSLNLVLAQAADLLIDLGICALAPARNPNPVGNGGVIPQLVRNAPAGPPVMNS